MVIGGTATCDPSTSGVESGASTSTNSCRTWMIVFPQKRPFQHYSDKKTDISCVKYTKGEFIEKQNCLLWLKHHRVSSLSHLIDITFKWAIRNILKKDSFPGEICHWWINKNIWNGANHFLPLPFKTISTLQRSNSTSDAQIRNIKIHICKAAEGLWYNLLIDLRPSPADFAGVKPILGQMAAECTYKIDASNDHRRTERGR